MKNRYKHYVLLGIFLVICIIILPRTVSGSPNSCSDLLFIYLRASGQTTAKDPTDLKDDLTEFNGQNEGEVFKKILEARLPDEIEITAESLNYPAFGELPEIAMADWDIGNKDGKYWTSKKRGTQMLVDRVNAERVRCPNQQVVIGGYSQGAHAVGDALYQLGADQAINVSYVGMFGDPRFNNESWAARGNFRSKAFGRSGGILERREEYPSHFKDRTESWCYHNDGFCDNRASRAMVPSRNTHGRYPEDGAIETVANNAALQVLKKFNEQDNSNLELRHKPTFGNKFDVVFVVDRAKTMAKTMSAAREGVDYFLANQLIQESDVCLGIVTVDEYLANQEYYQPIVTTQTPLGSVAKYKQEWSRFTINGGGTDKTSPMLSGISQAANTLDWRSDAEKHIVVMTDQPMKETEFFSGKSLAQVVTETQNKDIRINFATSVIGTKDIPQHEAMFRPLFEPTNGNFFAIHRFLTHEMINDLFTAINNMPIIKSQQQYTGTPGKAITYNLGDSYSPAGEAIMTYDWDFDNNGTYEYTTASAQKTHTYPEPYVGDVRVRVTTSSGKRTTSKFSVKIDENTHYYRPNAPSGVIIDFFNRKPRIRWIIPNKSSFDSDQSRSKHWSPDFASSVFANEPVNEAPLVYSVHGDENKLLGILTAGVDEVTIPDYILDQHKQIGLAAHTETDSSDIVYLEIPEDIADNRISDDESVSEELSKTNRNNSGLFSPILSIVNRVIDESQSKTSDNSTEIQSDDKRNELVRGPATVLSKNEKLVSGLPAAVLVLVILTGLAAAIWRYSPKRSTQ